MSRRLVKMMNTLTRLRRASCEPGQILLLLPRCIQHSGCEQRIANDIQECRRCGRCKVKDLLEMSERYGTRCAVATGGHLALELARDEGVRTVVAIACAKELQEGMKGIFPKPSVGIINLWPNGPCVDTDVELDRVEAAIERLIKE